MKKTVGTEASPTMSPPTTTQQKKRPSGGMNGNITSGSGVTSGVTSGTRYTTSRIPYQPTTPTDSFDHTPQPQPQPTHIHTTTRRRSNSRRIETPRTRKTNSSSPLNHQRSQSQGDHPIPTPDMKRRASQVQPHINPQPNPSRPIQHLTRQHAPAPTQDISPLNDSKHSNFMENVFVECPNYVFEHAIEDLIQHAQDMDKLHQQQQQQQLSSTANGMPASDGRIIDIDPAHAFSNLAHTSKLSLTKSNILIWQTSSPEYGLEHIDVFSLYYREYFFEKDHTNYLGIIEPLGPVIISVRREKQSAGSSTFASTDLDKSSSAVGGGGGGHEHRDSRLRVIIRGKAFSDWRLSFLETTLKRHHRLSSRQKLSRRMILPYLHKMMDPNKLIKVNSKRIERQLLKLDELNLAFNYKIGVLLVKDDQMSEEQIFGNEHSTPAFETFLDILGTKVELQGFPGFAAGLDTKNNNTGKYALHTMWREFKITYHVSTFLPYNASDSQQIQRKRHIGNDIVTLVFIDGKSKFNPSIFRSQFLHVFVVVNEEMVGDKVGYRVQVAKNNAVPSFGPGLPKPPVFTDRQVLREFLLTKVINAENAAYKAPKFAKLESRTRHGMIEEIVNYYIKNHASADDEKDKGTSRSKR